jgi:acyl transferase domain-containing protein/acyl carrier protein
MKNDSGLEREDIAIVGMACLFPGAENVSQYWHNIIHKVDCVTDPPPDWQPELFLDETGRNKDRVYVGKGGYLGDLSRFDAARYGIMPAGVEGAEPDQFLALRCAVEALEDARSHGADVNRERTGVIFGRGTFVNRGYVTSLHHGFIIDQVLSVLSQILDLSEEERGAVRADLKKGVPPFGADTVPGLCHSVLVGRIANRLDLKGPSHTVDAACASSLIAVDAAIRELRSGRCDAVLAGGVQVSTPAVIDLMFCHLEALSRTGKVAPFSSEANGTLLGEGCGIVVLKRRRDAERDGNRIYALLKGVGISSDGKGGGLLAPQPEGQMIAIRQAYELTGVDTGSIGLVEAHGTGIPLGDRTELQSLRGVFGSRNGRPQSIAIGSVKSMISHLIPAAGVASLIKIALALYHRVLPPTLHGEKTDPSLGLDETPFYVSSETRPWVHGDRSTPRRAAVDAFGFGGINAHLVMEEHRPDDAASPMTGDLDREWPVELVVVSAEGREALRRRLESLSSWLSRAPDAALLDVAAACARESGSSRIAILAKDCADLERKLLHSAERLAEPGRTRIQDRSGIFYFDQPLAREGKIAFLFPGEGAQYVGMLSDLTIHFSEVRREFDLADEAFRRAGFDRPLSRAVFPIPDERESAENELFSMEMAIESATTADRALLALVRSLGIVPDGILGHSSGEFAALVAAGAVVLDDDEAVIESILEGLECTRALNEENLVPEAVLTAVGGADIAAVSQVVAASGGVLTVAMDNCPNQMVLAGDARIMRTAVAEIQRQGGICERLPWDRAYHTEHFAPACEPLARYFASLDVRTPELELWSCAARSVYPKEPERIRELAVAQWKTPVFFRDTVDAMYERGYRVFIEVGPRGNLSAFASDTLGKRPHAAVPLDLSSKPGRVQLARALGQLAAHGVPMRLEDLYNRRGPKALDLGSPPPAPPRRPPVLRLDLPELKLSEGTAGSLRARTRESSSVEPRAASAPAVHEGDSRTRAFSEFQSTMRAFLDTQEAALRALLGTGTVPSPPQDVLRPLPSTPPAPEAPSDRDEPTSETTPVAWPEGLGSDDLLKEVISERTGYPTGVLDLDAHLEAELGIDSIKRVEIIAAFRRKAAPEVKEPPAWFMEEMSEARTARDILRGVEKLTAGPSGSAPVEAPPPLPLIHRVLYHEPGRRLRAECRLDSERDPFLLDHSFGRLVSTRDASLRALTVMPLAMTMELMAEAAAALAPGRKLVRLKDVRASSWLSFATRERRLEVEAETSGGGVDVVVYEADREGSPVHARARVEFSEDAPALPALLVIGAELSPSRWTTSDLYGNGMFHGPAFQVLSSLSGRSSEMVAAQLKEPAAPLFSDEARASRPLLPVALLDGIGQAVGLFIAEEELAMCFPTGVERLDLAPAGAVSGPFELVARVRRDGSRSWISDAELKASDGKVLVSVRGRRDQDAQLPPHFWRYRANPFEVAFSRSVVDLFRNVPGIEHCAIASIGEFAGEFLTEADGLWALDLSRYVLGREERAVFQGLGREPSRLSWLLERAVMKDAVRLLTRERSTMADVEIPGDGGVVVAADGDGYEAMAIAGDGKAIGGVGIAFAGEAEVSAARAAAKALGLRKAEELKVNGFDPEAGRFELVGDRGRAFAFTRPFGGRKAAISIVPRKDVEPATAAEGTESKS